MPEAVYNFLQHETVKQYYEETRFASREPLFGRINWILGTSFSRQRFHADDRGDQSAAFVGIYLDPPDYFSTGLSVGHARYVQIQNSFGVFANTSTDLATSLRLILGLRYSHDKVGVDGLSTEDGSAEGGILFQGVGATVVALDEARRSNRFTYKAGLEYDLRSHIMAYASVSTGIKSGIYHLDPSIDPGDWRYAGPEKLTSYEIGLKNTLFNRMLTLNLSGFYYDYRNRQSSVLFISPFTGAFAAAIVNVPKSRVFGVDLDTTIRLTRGPTLFGTLTWLDAKVLRTIQDVDGQPLFQALNVGDTLAQTPKLSYSVRGTYSHAVGAGRTGTAQLFFSRSGKQLTSSADPLGRYGPNSSLDGRLSLADPVGWTVSLWGENLTNNNDIIYAASSFVGRTTLRRKPISYGAEIGYRF